MTELSTTAPKGTGLLARGKRATADAWASRRLATRFEALALRLNDVETAMYSHREPEEAVPALATRFHLPGVAGNLVSLERILSLGKPVLLVFTDPHGETGKSLLATIGSWQDRHQAPITAVGIAPVNSARSASMSLPAGITDFLFPDEHQRVARDFGVVLTPAVVLIRPNGALAGTPIVGVRGIQTMLESLAGAAAEAARLREERIQSDVPEMGSRAPLVLLPDLNDIDQEVVTANTPHVLLFWSPDCGYCDQLVPDLHTLESAPPKGLPPITLVARGSEAANRAQGFSSRTLLDHDLSASTAFGVFGTPAAVIVNGDGIVISPIARGIRGVRELLALPVTPLPDSGR